MDADLKVASLSEILEEQVLKMVGLCAIELLLHLDGETAVASSILNLNSHKGLRVGQVSKNRISFLHQSGILIL